MATRFNQGAAHAAPTIPLDILLSVLPSLPRPVLARVTMRLIDHMDTLEDDPDLEEDDPAGGNVEDEGERDEGDTCEFAHGTDQRVIWGRFAKHWEVDRG